MLQPARYLKHLQPSYIREILSAATRPEVISLAGGLPAESCFPMDLMEDSLATLSSRPELFQYGSTQGYAPLVEHIETDLAMPSHKAMVCNGSQQALDLVARAFLDPGDTVVMEAPGYLGAIQIFSLAQATMLPVEQYADGPDTDRLQELFESNDVKFFYSVPDFHNPTGVAWSLQKRQQVAALCQEYDVTLIEDAPYRDIRFAGTAQPMVSSFCPDHSIVLRSFSKSICPGMRLGIAMAAQKPIEIMVKVKQAADLHTSVPMQAVLLDTLKHSGFSSHLASVCEQYGQRYRAMHDAILEGVGDRVSFTAVEGGMFVWVKIPDGDAMEIALRAIDVNLAVVPGDVFFFDDTKHDCHLRLNFTHTPPEQFFDAIQRLRMSI